jgi:hypothetical protein
VTKNETIKILRSECERLAREVEGLMIENGKLKAPQRCPKCEMVSRPRCTNPWAWSPGPTKTRKTTK